MRNVHYYLDKLCFCSKFGYYEVSDGMLRDGLWDVYNDCHMGSAGELCAREYQISREEQDAYAAESYKRALNARDSGYFKDEITEIKVKDRRGTVSVVAEDEELNRLNR